jgi:hypothetical protein
MKTLRLLVAALLVVAGFSGCMLAPKIETADDLADTLVKKGLNVDTREPIDFPDMTIAKIDEGIQLSGPDTTIDILRIEDTRTYDVFHDAQSILQLIGSKLHDSAEQPPVVVSGRPFVVVIREAPDRDKVAALIREVLPADAQ